MASIKIKGDTSGSTTITAPATGSDETIELSTTLASKLDLAGGKILQIVRATDNLERSTTSTSFSDVTGMSVTITPQKSTSAIMILGIFFADTAWTTSDEGIVRFEITDSSNNPISGAQQGAAGVSGLSGTSPMATDNHLTMVGYVTPATTSAVTYKLRMRVLFATTTARVRNNIQTGQMYAIEVSA